MKDLKLNAEGDLALEDADLALVEGAAEIGQGVKLALGSIRGEYILDTSAGLDLFGLVLGKSDPALRDAEIKREMLARPGVAALVSYAAAVDASTRVLTVSAELRAEDGERIVERNTRIYIPEPGEPPEPPSAPDLLPAIQAIVLSSWAPPLELDTLTTFPALEADLI